MDPNEVVRVDFPETEPGFERKSVVAHLEAVAAQLSAVQARVRALEVELDAVRESGMEGVPEQAGGDLSEEVADAAAPAGEQPSSRAGGDEVAARLVATELVLDGVPRDEVIARIRKEYGPPNPAALVDEVISRSA